MRTGREQYCGSAETRDRQTDRGQMAVVPSAKAQPAVSMLNAESGLPGTTRGTA